MRTVTVSRPCRLSRADPAFPLNIIGAQRGTEKAAIIVAPAGGIVQNTTSLSSGNPIAAQILVANTTGVSIGNLTADGANSQVSVSGCTPVRTRAQAQLTTASSRGTGSLRLTLDGVEPVQQRKYCDREHPRWK